MNRIVIGLLGLLFIGYGGRHLLMIIGIIDAPVSTSNYIQLIVSLILGAGCLKQVIKRKSKEEE